MSNQGDDPTPEQYQYFLQHASDNRAAGMLVCTAVTVFFSTFFILLRLVGRRLTHQRWYVNISDCFIIVSWVFAVASGTSLGLSTRYGGGRHIIFVTSKKGVHLTGMTAEFFYAFSMGFLKLSILALYGSVFPSRRFHYCLWALGAFTALWSLMSAIGAICQCIPIESYWDDSVEGHCMEYGILQFIATVCNIVTDFIILFLPIRQVQRLHASKEKKRWIYFSFAMGGSACIVSIIRLVFALQVGSVDGSWDSIPAAWASEVEISLGFLVVSIPTYRPIYRKIMGGLARALDAQARKPYQLESVYYGSNNVKSPPNRFQTPAQQTPSQTGIVVVHDIELMRHDHHSVDWIRVAENGHVRSGF